MASDLKSTISISSLVELMTTGELIPSVKELFLELDGGMGTLRLSLEDDGGNALVLQEIFRYRHLHFQRLFRLRYAHYYIL